MIHLEDINVHFGSFQALNNINLTINEGEFFTFLGPSGCGKTTTLRTIAGFIKPSSGNIFINEKNITEMPIEKRNIGMVFQSYALFPTLNVYENIAFGLKVKKIKNDVIAHKVQEIAKKVDLSEMQLQKKVSELSGGQQQRVAIARALVLKPQIMCLDEPLSNLDAKLRVQLRNELKSLQQVFGITTIYVTHDQEEALTLSDRIAVFNNGVIEQVGTPNEIYNRSKTDFVCTFVGDINPIPQKILIELKNNGLSTLDVEKKSYIRLERLRLAHKDENNNSIEGEICASEYYGIYIKYHIKTKWGLFKIIEKEGSQEAIKEGSKVRIVFNHEDIMQYNYEV